jgi:hypothetical protein
MSVPGLIKGSRGQILKNSFLISSDMGHAVSHDSSQRETSGGKKGSLILYETIVEPELRGCLPGSTSTPNERWGDHQDQREPEVHFQRPYDLPRPEVGGDQGSTASGVRGP